MRVLAQAKPQPGAPVKTTIDPELQEAAVSALAGRAGGIAVLDTRNGDVRALAGQAFSAPQPPGSTFKLITTVAALREGRPSRSTTNSRSPTGSTSAVASSTTPTASSAAAPSANRSPSPATPSSRRWGRRSATTNWSKPLNSFGFNSPPTLYAPRTVREVEPAESTIPTEIGEEIDLGVSAIGQGEVLATPLQMASVAQTIANGGVREPTSIVRTRKLRPQTEPVRVMSAKLAGEMTELMIGVVTEGTGTAGAIPEAQVAGKTGTAELGPKPGQENEENPIQIKDAWFAAFAPAEKPRLAVGVLLIEAEAAGGEVAAPAAAQVLSAGLQPSGAP